MLHHVSFRHYYLICDITLVASEINILIAFTILEIESDDRIYN